MDHDDVLNKILKYLKESWQVKNLKIFEQDVTRTIHTSLVSLYAILMKTEKEIELDIQEQMGQWSLSDNCSPVVPSTEQLLCMCKVNENLFDENTFEKMVANSITNFFNSTILISYKPECSKEFSLIWLKEVESMWMLLEKKFSLSENCLAYKFYAIFYYYLFIVLEENFLVDDSFKPHEDSLLNNWIYLPLEGTVNLVYFNYIVNPNTTKFSKAIDLNYSVFKSDEISQYDCGFEETTHQTSCINENELIYFLNPEVNKIKEIDKDMVKKYIDIPLKWLACMHIVVPQRRKHDDTVLKLIKVLYDVSSNSNIKGFCNRDDKFSVYKVLSNVDECNFNVRGILYGNGFGNVSTGIKSTIFRELSLDIIEKMEHYHDTIMDVLGIFAKQLCNEYAINDKTSTNEKEALFKRLHNVIDNYTFECVIRDEFSNDALIQMVSWFFLSEIYAYLKTEVVIVSYMISNFESIRDNYDYSPEKVPNNLFVLFKDLSLHWKDDCEKSGTSECKLEDFYKEQTCFSKSQIFDLVEQTKTVMLNFYADTLLYITNPQVCSLRQFMAVSLVLVKSQKGKTIFPQIPEFKFYGHKTQRLSVYEFLTNQKLNLDLKRILFASKLFEHQNHAFIESSRIDLYDEFIVKVYGKIMDFLCEKIPIIKNGNRNKAEALDKKLKERYTPYSILMSLYDITLDIIDNLSDEMP